MTKLSFCTVMIIFSLSCKAQSHFGIRGGITLPGKFHAGAIIERQLDKNFAFTAEALFNQKEINFRLINIQDGMGLITLDNIRYSLSYIQIPLGLKFSMGEELKSYFMGGAAFSCLLNHKVNNAAYDSATFSTVDISGYIGLGLQYKKFFIDTRYNPSFNNAVKYGPSKFKNKAGMISIGYLFN
jgi:hypothetical protein